MKKNVLIVEDESIVAMDIQQSLVSLGYEVLGIASSGKKAKEFLSKKKKPDIILMDIMIKGDMTGIDVSAYVKEHHQIPVVFLTAYADDQTLEKAKNTEPYGYILKPFKEVDLKTNIEMALHKHKVNSKVKKELDAYATIVSNSENSKPYIFIKNKSRFIKTNVDDLFFVEALKDYVIFHTEKEKYTLHCTMKEIESKLPKESFARVHRSFIVNLDKIHMIEYVNAIIKLETVNKQIPMGASYKQALFKKFNLI
ncbi:MAG: two-component system response regulator LytT [Glaciecola sp.]|jgi:two-component system response regulator LytT